MSRLMDMAGVKAHERRINVSTYGVDDDRIVVEGSLVDDRLKEYYLITGEKRQPGEIHHMVIRLLVKIPEMLIEDIEVEMNAVPREECLETAKTMDVIKGMMIKSGFTLKVKELLSGTKGCTHLVALITLMAPAVFQGVWSYKSQKPVDTSTGSKDKTRVKQMEKVLKNTCYVWRENGPRYEKLKNVLDEFDI